MSNHESIGREAARAMREGTGLDADYIEGIDLHDGSLRISRHRQGVVYEIACEIIPNIKAWQLSHILSRYDYRPEEVVLISHYINPSIQKQLIMRGINFADTVGNFRIERGDLYISQSGQKPKRKESHEIGRAFDQTGMKLILAFLTREGLIHQPYRTIAETTGVALGAIGTSLRGMASKGHILFADDALRRELVVTDKLIDQWVFNYIEAIKPKLLIGQFKCETNDWWNTTDVREFGALWGAEMAASKSTNYLRPEVATMYIEPKEKGRLLSRFRMRKDTSGPNEIMAGYKVELYEKFAPDQIAASDSNDDLVNPLITYADLIGSQDTRNAEAAEIVYDTYIARYIRQN